MKNATSTDRAVVDCPVPNCGCHYHAEDGTLCDYAKSLLPAVFDLHPGELWLMAEFDHGR